MGEGDKVEMSLSFSSPLSWPVSTDETFPTESEVILTTYPVSWVCWGTRVPAVCDKCPSLLPPPPSPHTGPSVQQQDCCSEGYQGGREGCTHIAWSAGAGWSWLCCVSC